MSEKLELIERALELYLETKRQLFPRFYFISNDDMLEILGNAKKPDVVQQHLRKLFDNLYKLKLDKVVLGIDTYYGTKTETFYLFCNRQYEEKI